MSQSKSDENLILPTKKKAMLLDFVVGDPVTSLAFEYLRTDERDIFW